MADPTGPAHLPPRTGIRRAASAALVILALAAFVLIASWHSLFPENFGEVFPGILYRSADLTPAATDLVHSRHHIRTIVDLGAYHPGSPEEATAQRTADALGVRRYVFRLEGDGTGNPNAYVAALRVIADPANQPVLVHCAAGAQRTSGCVILYHHYFEGRSIEDVYPESFGFRHSPRKNPRLRPYLDRWVGAIDAALRTGSHVPGFDPLDAGSPIVLPTTPTHPAAPPTLSAGAPAGRSQAPDGSR
jgi:hypothetical protein